MGGGVVVRGGREVSARAAELLKAAGIAVTRRRAAVLDALIAADGHLTIRGIVERCRRDGEPASFTTTFRTLQLLVDAGVVDVFRGHRLAEYQLASADHHDHLVCLDCGRVVEDADPRIEALQERVARARGFRVVGHRHVMHCRCEVLDCPRRRSRRES
jgi:Fur family ferric uptake transcriptional regulator